MLKKKLLPHVYARVHRKVMMEVVADKGKASTLQCTRQSCCNHGDQGQNSREPSYQSFFTGVQGTQNIPAKGHPGACIGVFKASRIEEEGKNHDRERRGVRSEECSVCMARY